MHLVPTRTGWIPFGNWVARGILDKRACRNGKPQSEKSIDQEWESVASPWSPEVGGCINTVID